MGRPRLFCGVTAGNLDSMLANYTAARHKRREDDYSAGGLPGRRPNHAAVVYAQLARGAFPGLPVVLGGIEASLRRVAHYDYWEDKLRPSILVDAKADLLVYGMGESAVREIARRLSAAAGRIPPTSPASAAPPACSAPRRTRAPARLGGARASSPSWEELQADRTRLLAATRLVEAEQSPFCGRRLVQFHGARAVVVEPPAPAAGRSGAGRPLRPAVHAAAAPVPHGADPGLHDDQGFGDDRARLRGRLQLLRPGSAPGQVHRQPQRGLDPARAAGGSPPTRASAAR